MSRGISGMVRLITSRRVINGATTQLPKRTMCCPATDRTMKRMKAGNEDDVNRPNDMYLGLNPRLNLSEIHQLNNHDYIDRKIEEGKNYPWMNSTMVPTAYLNGEEMLPLNEGDFDNVSKVINLRIKDAKIACLDLSKNCFEFIALENCNVAKIIMPKLEDGQHLLIALSNTSIVRTSDVAELQRLHKAGKVTIGFDEG